MLQLVACSIDITFGSSELCKLRRDKLKHIGHSIILPSPRPSRSYLLSIPGTMGVELNRRRSIP